MNAQDNGHKEAIPEVQRAAFEKLYSHLVEHEFHCAKAVLIHLGYTPDENPDLFDAVSAFIGGTLFMGKTCGALTACVMAAGLKIGEIENSIPRVVLLLTRMTFGGNAFDDRINKFNPSMNWGFRFSKWFRREFGSTQCHEITQSDFTDSTSVGNYIEKDYLARCKSIAEKSAEKFQQVMAEKD